MRLKKVHRELHRVFYARAKWTRQVLYNGETTKKMSVKSTWRK